MFCSDLCFLIDSDIINDIFCRENGLVNLSSERASDCQIQQQEMRSTERVEISDAALSGFEGENRFFIEEENDFFGIPFHGKDMEVVCEVAVDDLFAGLQMFFVLILPVDGGLECVDSLPVLPEFENIDFSFCGPVAVAGIRAEGPESGPDTLPDGEFRPHFSAAVKEREGC